MGVAALERTRELFDRVLVDRATVRRRNPSTGAWATSTADLPCRVSAAGMADPERVSEVAGAVVVQLEVKVPHDADVRRGDQLQVEGRRLEVLAVAPVARVHRRVTVRAEGQ